LKTLVVYDTKHGASAEVAERIAAACGRVQGRSAETLDLRSLDRRSDLRASGGAAESLAEYGAVVLGGPVYMGRWAPRISAFASARAGELAGKRLVCFALGSVPGSAADAVRSALPPELGRAADGFYWFGGRVDYPRLGMVEKLIVKAVSGKAESYSALELSAIDVLVASLMEDL
jgi:menaquinone-dependent protoporphyrinogen oxidase